VDFPTPSVVNEHVSVTLVNAFTTKLYAPAVAGLLESPPYFAVIMTEEPGAAGVNHTQHVLKAAFLVYESVQVALENLPGLLLDQATVPVGAAVLDSWTVAIQ